MWDDRFQEPTAVDEPTVIGDCPICGEEMQACEADSCESCDVVIHEECMDRNIFGEKCCPVCAKADFDGNS